MAGVVQGVDLSPIIDRQKIGAFHVKLIAIAFLVVMADGYDIGAAAFAAPALIREWHVAPEALGGMFSAGLFAGFFGPLILGWISDHYGRRTAIISGAAFFGLFTLASVLAQNLATLIVLRFIAGVGISGVLRRWDPHRHEAADTISILHSGNSSGDRAHKRDLVDAAIYAEMMRSGS